MGRRRFANEKEELELLDEESESEESETDLTTQEEAFNQYSDFADRTRKTKGTVISDNSTSKGGIARKRRSKQRFRGETAWDQMLHEFERRQISKQQAQMIVGVILVLMFSFVFRGMFSSRRGGAGDLLDCFTVSSDNQGRDIVECRSRDGYNIRVIESHTNSLLLEVAEIKLSEPGFVSAIFSLIKYSVYLTLGLTLGALFGTPEGKERFKMLKRKYLEMSNEIKRKIENRLKQRDNNVYKARGREIAGLSASESDSSDDESSEESDSSMSR